MTGNYGIKVMMPTKDVSSTIPTDHIFNSAYGAVKIAQETYGSVVVPSGSIVAGTIAHNLGFAPMVLVYSKLKPDKWYFGFPYTYSTTVDEFTISSDPGTTYVGTSNVVIGYQNSSASQGTVYYKLFVMGDSG